MSSFNAKLHFTDNTKAGYSLLQCNYSFDQLIDAKGRPSSPARGGNIYIQVTTPPDDFLLKWMVDSYKTRGGIINFFKIDEESTFQRITFTGAYCVEFHTNFSAEGSSSMVTSIVISAKSLLINSVGHNNDWPE